MRLLKDKIVAWLVVTNVRTYKHIIVYIKRYIIFYERTPFASIVYSSEHMHLYVSVVVYRPRLGQVQDRGNIILSIERMLLK